MPHLIDKKTLEHLAELARIKLDEKEEEKLLADLSKILDYFQELQELDTSSVEPMTGGTDLKNVLREDGEREGTNHKAGVEQFPETKEGFLKIPPVFSE